MSSFNRKFEKIDIKDYQALEDQTKDLMKYESAATITSADTNEVIGETLTHLLSNIIFVIFSYFAAQHINSFFSFIFFYSLVSGFYDVATLLQKLHSYFSYKRKAKKYLKEINLDTRLHEYRKTLQLVEEWNSRVPELNMLAKLGESNPKLNNQLHDRFESESSKRDMLCNLLDNCEYMAKEYGYLGDCVTPVSLSPEKLIAEYAPEAQVPKGSLSLAKNQRKKQDL